MRWGRVLWAAILCVGAGACVRTIDEGDVFLPWMAEGTQFSITTEEGVLFTDNKPSDGLFSARNIKREEGVLPSPVGDIAYRLLRSPHTDRPLIVYCGGNSYDVPNHGDLAAWKLAPHGDAFLWDYPGYGDSEGAAEVSDFRAAVAALSMQIEKFRRDETQDLIFWGHSLGGFVCAELAAKTPAAYAIIFEGSAPSAEAASGYLAPRLIRPFVRIRMSPTMASFDNVATLRPTALPVLVLAAKKDQVLPVKLSEELRDALKAQGRFVEYYEFSEADHFTIGFQEDHDEAVAAFLSVATPEKQAMDRSTKQGVR